VFYWCSRHKFTWAHASVTEHSIAQIRQVLETDRWALKKEKEGRQHHVAAVK